MHDYDKIISGMRQKARKAKRKEDETSAKEEAEKIFDRFKAGEKLSTEDLMALRSLATSETLSLQTLPSSFSFSKNIIK